MPDIGSEALSITSLYMRLPNIETNVFIIRTDRLAHALTSVRSFLQLIWSLMSFQIPCKNA